MTDEYHSEFVDSGPGYLDSRRLRLVPATPALIDADLESRAALSGALDVEVPDEWPPDLYDRAAMQYTKDQLADRQERGWSTWYVTLRGRGEGDRLVGLCGFKGRPDGQGSVEIAYSVLSAFRNRGIASEAVARLVTWAFTHPRVSEVSAETLPHLAQSIKVLERNGFQFEGAGSEYGVVRYAVRRSSLR